MSSLRTVIDCPMEYLYLLARTLILALYADFLFDKITGENHKMITICRLKSDCLDVLT